MRGSVRPSARGRGHQQRGDESVVPLMDVTGGAGCSIWPTVGVAFTQRGEGSARPDASGGDTGVVVDDGVCVSHTVSVCRTVVEFIVAAVMDCCLLVPLLLGTRLPLPCTPQTAADLKGQGCLCGGCGGG
jgi:hypothetical protein